MKHKLTLFGTIGLAALVLTSFTVTRNGDEPQQPKKSRHIKMVKMVNGKKMELDTVLTGNDVFVWQGDTIGGKELGKRISPSGFDKKKNMKVVVKNDGKNESVMIIKDGKEGEPKIYNLDSVEGMELLTEDIDSLGKKIVIRKHMKGDDGENHMIFINSDDMQNFPPVPPIPHMKRMRMEHSGQYINLNDPNVVSFKKKDLKGGLEKIEIVRKKTNEPEDMKFDFQFGDQLVPPPPPPPLSPDAPEIIREYNQDGQHVKIIEHKKIVDGKENKELKVDVKPEEKK